MVNNKICFLNGFNYQTNILILCFNGIFFILFKGPARQKKRWKRKKKEATEGRQEEETGPRVQDVGDKKVLAVIWEIWDREEDQRRRRRRGTRTRRRCASRREWATCRCWRRGIVGRSPCASVCRSVAGRLQTREVSGPASSCWSPLEPARPDSPGGKVSLVKEEENTSTFTTSSTFSQNKPFCF